MSEKEKLPFWLGVVLGLILGMAGVLIVIMPQLDQSAQGSSAVDTSGLNNNAKNQATALQAPELDAIPDQSALNPRELSLSGDQPDNEMMHADLDAHVDQSMQTPAMQGGNEAVLDAIESSSGIADVQPLVPVDQKGKYGIALVIDDAGYDLKAVERVLALSVPVAISVLPESTFARQAAVLAKQAGQVVMLHLPMQPEDPSLEMTEDFLHGKMNRNAIRNTFLKDLAKVPFVEGVNNHMGSRLTQMDKPMHWVMQVCQEKGLFFVDSRTSARSVAATSAKSMGIAWASRSIFLDHEMTLEAMKHAWQRARNCAKKKLSCVIIAHPRAKTVAFLENYISKDDAKQMVSIRRLLQTTPIVSQASQSVLP
ncbi:MAG: divergent polysaccharide deacetylase family protein [Mariprofundus sp.]|nr:divergent polysaccharide deacetylase family protein [Mariprofundus sp.]